MKKLIYSFHLIVIWISTIILFSNCVFTQWERCDNGIPADLWKTDPFAQISASGNNVVAVTDGTPKMFISTDNGNNWEQCLALMPTSYSFLGLSIYNNYIITNQNGDYQISSNLGQTWRKIKDTIFKYCDECPFYMKNDTFYLAGEKYIYKSVDFGETWQNTYSGPSTFDLYSMNSFRNFDSNFIVTISGDGVKKFYPPDKIVEFNNGLPNLSFRVSSLLDIGNNFLITISSDLYISNDSLTKWDKIYHSPDYFNPIDSFWYSSDIDPVITCGNNIFASIRNPDDTTIIYSTNRGKNWTKIDEGIDTLIKSVFSSPPQFFAINDNYIYLTLSNSIGKGRIFRLKIKDCVPDFLNDVDEKKELIVSDLSPNPATDYIEISIEANARSPLQCDVRIFDVFGQNVLFVRAIHELPLRIDLSTLASGMYFVRIGDKIQKFIKL